MKFPLQAFVHVPKTGGTSFKHSCININFLKSEIYDYKGLMSFARASLDGMKFVNGHIPYGIHMMSWRQCDYFTLMRDPIDQIVSFYYFVRQGNYVHYKHPLLRDAMSLSLIDFARKHRNMQTKAIAGFPFGRILHGKIQLDMARRNLFQRFKFYGFLSDFDGFLSKWSNAYGLPHKSIYEKSKIMRKRPLVSELSRQEISALKDLQRLDLLLYEEAQDRSEHSV